MQPNDKYGFDHKALRRAKHAKLRQDRIVSLGIKNSMESQARVFFAQGKTQRTEKQIDFLSRYIAHIAMEEQWIAPKPGDEKRFIGEITERNNGNWLGLMMSITSNQKDSIDSWLLRTFTNAAYWMGWNPLWYVSNPDFNKQTPMVQPIFKQN